MKRKKISRVKKKCVLHKNKMKKRRKKANEVKEEVKEGEGEKEKMVKIPKKKNVPGFFFVASQEVQNKSSSFTAFHKFPEISINFPAHSHVVLSDGMSEGDEER